MESLEPRQLLHAGTVLPPSSEIGYDQVAPLWFQSGHQQGELSDSVDSNAAMSRSNFIGPQRSELSDTVIRQEWILRLSEAATAQIGSIVESDRMLDGERVNFDIVRGLGLPGMMLVESFSTTSELAEQWLQSNPFVSDFAANETVIGAQVPNDPLYPDMTNLDSTGQSGAAVDADIDAPQAWDVSTGNSSVVVGVIDSGVDVTHEDLFLNVWLNQNEIRISTLGSLTDTDQDGLITLWDLNNLQVIDSQVYVASTVVLDSAGDLVSGDLATAEQMTSQTPYDLGPNGSMVEDSNANGRIDAADLLVDSRWTDGMDGDQNGFVDDLFGWNFRVDADEPFAANNPSDEFGHGTHVTGTIAAVGNNGTGVAGLNWQTSVMPIKFLDAQNQGSQADAIAAINYATMMRSMHGVNVRVTNNSWQQPGEANPLLQSAIEASGEAGILFVTAAGNGDAKGKGKDLERTASYPASYDSPNLISVAASDNQDQLAPFSNFGSQSVDLAAPGVGVLSTLPGDRYGSANGTSVAAAHVSATAALIWSERPTASVEEVSRAILSSVDLSADLQDKVATGGRLNASSAIDADVFTPAANVIAVEDITTSGGTLHQFTVEYRYFAGIDSATIGDDDIQVARQWGSRELLDAELVPGSVESDPDGETVRATYQIEAVGGQWDPLDFGDYDIRSRAGSVASSSGLQFVIDQRIGGFEVRIDAPGVFYVVSGEDSVDANIGDGLCLDVMGNCSLRAAIQEANAAGPNPQTIILDVAESRIEIAHQADPSSTFPDTDSIDGLPSVANTTGWSGEATGDLDITGNVSIIGDSADLTTIRGAGDDRVFKVHPGASLALQRLTVTDGIAPSDQGGGAILTAGNLALDLVTISGNMTPNAANGLGGGGIAGWGGDIQISRSTIAENSAEIGGGILVTNGTTVNIAQSTLVANSASTGDGLAAVDPDLIGGGGIAALKSGELNIRNSTFSANTATNASGAAIGVFSLVPPVVVESTDVPVPIPDLATVRSQIEVTGFNDVLSDVDVRLSLEHTFVEDLEVALISPSGTRVELFAAIAAIGSGGDDLEDTIFNDDALTDIEDGQAPYTGLFRPQGNLSDLIGEDPNGIWELEIKDNTVNDIGTLTYWALDMEPLEGSSARGFLDHVTTVNHDGASALAGRVWLHSSLIAEDLATPIDSFVTDRGFNLVSDPSTVGELQYVGGPTFAHPLLEGSAAIDGGDPGNFPLIDQAGTTRPQRGDSFLVTPDVGAIEMINGFAAGQVFLDRDADTLKSVEEIGLPDLTVFVDLNGNGELDGDEPHAITADSDEIGSFLFSNLQAGPYNIVLQVPDNWRVSFLENSTNVRMNSEDVNHYAPALSYDGNSVAYLSDVVPDLGPLQTRVLVMDRELNEYYTPFFQDLFAFPPEDVTYSAFDTPSLSDDARYLSFVDEYLDPITEVENNSVEVTDTRVTDAIQAGVSVASELIGYTPTNGMVSGDGRYIAFTSDDEIHLFDRQTSTISLISVGLGGEAADGPSRNVSVSRDGRFIAFESAATNLVADDNNDRFDVFVLDRETNLIERVNVSEAGAESGEQAENSSISADGHYVLFDSLAANLVAGDGNDASDVFAVHLESGTIERISEATGGGDSDGASTRAAISATGRFIVYESVATNLIDDDTNEMSDLFVIDRLAGITTRVAQAAETAAISGDGKYVAYTQGTETFVERNPLASVASRSVVLHTGETVDAAPLGLIPEQGTITGILFEDLVGNAIRDVADPGIEGWTVYLDTSQDGQLDDDEPTALTDAEGRYQFLNLDGYAEYLVRAEAPDPWVQVHPNTALFDGQMVFVDAGETVADVDFGFVLPPDDPQNQDAMLSGIVFSDTGEGDNEGDGVQQPEELGVADLTVYIDLNDDGIKQELEPSTITDATGAYSFSNLGSGSYVVRILEYGDSAGTSTPRGNDFALNQIEARSGMGTLGGVREMVLTDLDGDQNLDLISILYDANALSIRLGDGEGSFAETAILVALHPLGDGPVGIAAGDLNQQNSTDLVVVNQISGNALVMLDFDGATFGSINPLDVGSLPSDVVIGDFDGLNGNDFAVANSGDNSITLMLNDGSGGFTSSSIENVGTRPTSLVAGHFNDDLNLDLAVANFGDYPSGADLGNLAVLINQGNASFAAAVNYDGGFGPSSVTTADINGDGQTDLAVTGQLSKTVSVFLGDSSGVFAPLGEPVPLEFEPFEIAASDIDEDGDEDLVVTASDESGFVVIRNDPSLGASALTPPERFSLGPDSPDERSEIVIGDVIGDVTMDSLDDIVLTGESGEIINVLRNRLSNGSHRLFLTGVEQISNLDFGLLPPFVDSIILEGEGETVDMAALEEVLRTHVILIDIRGTGDNTLILDAPTIQSETPNQTLLAIGDMGDVVVFDAGWTFSHTEVVDGQFERIYVNGIATLRLIGPTGWTNPIIAADVNDNGAITALDALTIINALGPRAFVDDDDVLVDPATVDPARYKFYDTNADGRLLASDALYVINRIGVEDSEPESEAIAAIAADQIPSQFAREDDDVDAVLASTWDWR